ncbi:MAG TPA: Gldg family protein [Chitinophaga sp.]
MTKTLKIAKLELSVLFYSPIAWLVLTIFMVQCGIGFFNNLSGIEMNLASGYNAHAITRSIFTGNFIGLLDNVQSNLYLYLPILTMGLMSRETSSGSIKLLLSSPVKLTEIIIGKYLAIITYGLCLMAVLLVYVAVAAISVQHVDLGLVWSGLLGIYLLICTYSAIGLFMSCLTSYQVVAAISTLAVFAALKFVGTMGQDINFIRDLTYFLSISGRVENMINGLIISRDIFYYLIIICTFLALCILVLKGQRELKSWPVKAMRYAALLAGALMLGYITSRQSVTAYWDTSADQAYTISRNGQEVAKQFKDKLEVTTYVNMLAANFHLLKPSLRNTDFATLERYKRFIPGMETRYVYYYAKPADSMFSNYRFNPRVRGMKDIDSIAAETANTQALDKNDFIGPAEVDKLADLKSEGYASIRQLKYHGKSAFLRFYVMDMNPYPSEREVIGAMERLLKKVPKVVFLQFNNTRGIQSQGDRDYQLAGGNKGDRGSLPNQGFDVDTVDLNRQNIPANADIVVLADPSVPFTDSVLQKLTAYINKGGNMLINGDPASRDILNPLLAQLGLQLKPGMLLTADKDQSPGFISASLSPGVQGADTILDMLLRNNATVAMQGAAAIETVKDAGFKAMPILTSPAGGWNTPAIPDPAQTTVRIDTAKRQQGVFPVLMGLTRQVNGRQQRIIVSGDADFMSNGEYSHQPPRGANETFTLALFSWLCDGAFPFNPSTIPARDKELKVSREKINTMGWICKGVIPAIIVMVGGILLLRRRRK